MVILNKSKLMTQKKAIAEKCKDCIYDEFDPGTWVMQVESCIDKSCPLYTYRPITKATKDKIKEEKYQNMTPEERFISDKKSEEARIRFGKWVLK